MRTQFVRTLFDLMAHDTRLVLLLADVGEFQFRDIFAAYPSRAYNLGIGEQAVIDAACGLSMAGFIPVVYGIAPFIVERAYEQIKLAALNGAKFILVSVGASYDYGREGPAHHCPADVPLLYQIPGLNIVVPGTSAEMDSLLRQALAGRALPLYVRLSEVENPVSYPVQFGEPLVIRWEEYGVPALSVGPTLANVLEAGAGRVVYVTSLRPLGYERFCGLDNPLIVEPYYPLLGGLLAHRDDGPFRSIGVRRERPDRPMSREELDRYYGLDAESIRQALEGVYAG